VTRLLYIVCGGRGGPYRFVFLSAIEQ